MTAIKMTTRIPAGFLFCCIAALVMLSSQSCHIYAEETVVVVLDPGHGGENLGADYNGLLEKNMNLITANAMYEVLSQYDGIEVYLTRTEDTDMSLEKRVDFAKSVNADFFICLHYNMSENHTLFGTEVWVPSSPKLYVPSYTYGQIQLEKMTDLGLYSRGIKTRLNSRGTDYYGILRHCAAYDIPAVLIEHSHVDHINDIGFCDTPNSWKQLGIADAEAAAEYFGLKSRSFNQDYSKEPIPYRTPAITMPSERVKPDITPPDFCNISIIQCNYETGELSLKIQTIDEESSILYYAYSLDDGVSYSELLPWENLTPGSSLETVQRKVSAQPGSKPVIRVMVYNGFDLNTESNRLELQRFPKKATKESESSQNTNMTVMSENIVSGENRLTDMDKILIFLEICLFISILFCVMILTKKLLRK